MDYKKLSDEAYKMLAEKPKGVSRDSIFEKMSIEDKAMVQAAKDESLRLKKERAECKACEESFKLHQYVCPKHYHDYCDCGSDVCYVCLILERNPYEY